MLKDEVDVCFVLFFECSEPVMQARLLERGKTSGRADDNVESLRKRFTTYKRETMPVVELYRGKGACLAVLRGVAQGNPHGHSEAVTQCEFTPDAVSLVSASDDTLIKVWDPR